MPYLQDQWKTHGRQLSPLRRYSNQREFEADWVGTLRRRYSLSQEALAAMANVSVTTVQNWENPQSHKSIAPHNQDRLRDIERDLWIKSHVTLLEPCPPFLRALYDLLSANKDSSAQGLAEYLIGSMPEQDPERPRLLHWAGLAYSIADPASTKAREYQNAALRALGQSLTPLAAAVENEILGSQFEDLMLQTPGPERTDKGRHLLAACERLYQRDHQAAYKWNALEVACRTPLPAATQYDLLGELNQLLGESSVRRKIQSDDAYEVLRTASVNPAGLN